MTFRGVELIWAYFTVRRSGDVAIRWAGILHTDSTLTKDFWHYTTPVLGASLVWGIAIVGIIINALWINCPKWFSSVIYIAMGWVCIMAIRQIVAALTPAAFTWLLAGGIIYTIGGVIYALKLPIFNSKHKNFGSHEIFHLFVMGGSFCHYMMMYGYVAAA